VIIARSKGTECLAPGVNSIIEYAEDQ